MVNFNDIATVQTGTATITDNNVIIFTTLQTSSVKIYNKTGSSISFNRKIYTMVPSSVLLYSDTKTVANGESYIETAQKLQRIVLDNLVVIKSNNNIVIDNWNFNDVTTKLSGAVTINNDNVIIEQNSSAEIYNNTGKPITYYSKMYNIFPSPNLIVILKKTVNSGASTVEKISALGRIVLVKGLTKEETAFERSGQNIVIDNTNNDNIPIPNINIGDDGPVIVKEQDNTTIYLIAGVFAIISIGAIAVGLHRRKQMGGI